MVVGLGFGLANEIASQHRRRQSDAMPTSQHRHPPHGGGAVMRCMPSLLKVLQMLGGPKISETFLQLLWLTQNPPPPTQLTPGAKLDANPQKLDLNMAPGISGSPTRLTTLLQTLF